MYSCTFIAGGKVSHFWRDAISGKHKPVKCVCIHMHNSLNSNDIFRLIFGQFSPRKNLPLYGTINPSCSPADLDENRLCVAREMGADHTVKVVTRDTRALAQQITETLGSQPTQSIECSGAEPSIATAIYVCHSSTLSLCLWVLRIFSSIAIGELCDTSLLICNSISVEFLTRGVL